MKKVLLKDIARHVGVSTALVSYVLNGQAEEKQVGKEVAIKIRKAADELNYRPNQIAKSLKTQKTHTIGIVVADINYRYTSGVTKAIEAECRQFDYSVIYGSSGEDAGRFAKLVNILLDRQVAGLILVPVEGCEEQIALLNKQEVPLVLIDRILPGVEANIIAIDNAQTAYRAVKHLIDNNHRRIGFISYRSGLLNLAERKNGYYLALRTAGLEPDPALIKEISDKTIPGSGPAFSEQVTNAIDDLLALPEPCDSIFFATDTLAVEGLRHINALHIRVPEKLGIVSFDGSEAFELFYCPITHGVQPLEEIGRVAVNTLLDAMKHPKTKKKILLDTEFKVGRSCGEK